MNNSFEGTAAFASTQSFASLVHVLSNSSDSEKAMAEALLEISEFSSSDLTMIVQKSDLNILHESIAFTMPYLGKVEKLNDDDSLVKVLRENWSYEKELSTSGYFSGHTESYKGTVLGDSLSERNVSSFLILPIVKNTIQWGYLCLFEVDAPRLWSKDFIKAMKSVSSILAFFLHNLELTDELRRKEVYLKQAVESSNDGNWEIDLMNNSIHFSRQWKAMLGYSDHDLKNEFETFEDLLHPDDKDIVLAVLDPYAKVGLGDYECQYRLRTQRGTYKWVLTRASVLNNTNGLPERFVATNIDVTTRVKFVESLRKEERKYEELIDSVQEIIFKTNPEGIFTYLNAAWERTTGFISAQVIGQSCFEYLFKEDRDFTQHKMKELAAGQSGVNNVFEIRFLTKSGKTVWVEANIAVRKSANGDVEEFYGTFFDVQRRKSAEFNSTYSEEKFTSISDSMADLIIQIDHNGRIIYASNASTSILGAEPEMVKGKKALSFVHPDDRSLVIDEIYSGFRKGAKKVIKEYRIVRVDGITQWIETLAQPILSQEGKITYLAVIRDIALRKKAEDEIKRNLLQEKRLSELKSRFLTMTSHEFRTPLSSIKSSIELLDMYTADLDENKKEAFRKHFNRMISQIDRIDGLLDSIHIVGQSQSDQLDFSPELTNLENFIEDVVKRRLNYQDDRSINISVTGASRKVKVDQHHLLIAVKNILVNALTYSKGAPSPTCEIVYKEDEFCIVVQDFGVGIPESELDKVFESFYRAQNIINENIPGNGLGLMIALRMVREHHGDISIRSEVGKGTTVSICIPYQ